MPDTANLDLYEGDDYTATVLVTDASGNAVDLTGYTISAQVRVGPADANPTVAVEITCTFTAPNQIMLTIPHSTTKTLSGRYMWDLQVKSSTGIITTILAGGVTVTAEITRETGDQAVVAAAPGPFVHRIFQPLPRRQMTRLA
jgi:hypothetical protein